MNFVDRAVGVFNPIKAVKMTQARAILKAVNSGYGDAGASKTKRAFRGFTAKSKSPQSDIDEHHKTLIERSRVLYMSSPIACSAVKTISTNVVGSGLKLKSRIDFEFLGLTQEQAEIWENNIEREFALWTDTRFCDALRLNNFYEMQGLILKGQLLNGDGFCLLKHAKATNYMPYSLRLQIIEGDRVSTPNSLVSTFSNGSYFGVNQDNNNKIYSGVEIDNNGTTTAYHISNQYPYYDFTNTREMLSWNRVEAYGKKTGRPNILHIFDAERAEQRRGVPLLAPVIEQLQQLNRYTEAELMASVINGMFTAFVTTAGDTSQNEFSFMNDESVSDNSNDYELSPGAIIKLAPGEKIEIADPKRPSTAFDGFVGSLCKSIGSALEIPQELLLKSFTSSYSASRAALLESWKMFRMRREWMAREFCQPVYEMFLTEAIARGRIKAPNFFSDPIIRKAWCNANWNGASMGMIDPIKEVRAAEFRVANGFSTREEETMGLTGGDYDRNVKQLQRENEMLRKARGEIDEKQTN